MKEQRAVARLYGELRSLIRRLPQEQQQEKFDAARRLMSEHYREMDRAKRSDVLKKLVSQTSFLRMVAPRCPGDGSITGARFVFRDGGLVEDSSISDGIRVASSVMDMNDARVKHHQLLKRQHYGREPPAYDPRSF